MRNLSEIWTRVSWHCQADQRGLYCPYRMRIDVLVFSSMACDTFECLGSAPIFHLSFSASFFSLFFHWSPLLIETIIRESGGRSSPRKVNDPYENDPVKLINYPPSFSIEVEYRDVIFTRVWNLAVFVNFRYYCQLLIMESGIKNPIDPPLYWFIKDWLPLYIALWKKNGRLWMYLDIDNEIWLDYLYVLLWICIMFCGFP